MRHGNAKVKLSRQSAAKKKRRQRDEMRRLGFKLTQVWLHPRDRGHVLDLVRGLIRARTKAMIMSAGDDLLDDDVSGVGDEE
jgi:hypothetical protein